MTFHRPAKWSAPSKDALRVSFLRTVRFDDQDSMLIFPRAFLPARPAKAELERVVDKTNGNR